jgi:hypothetical protein
MTKNAKNAKTTQSKRVLTPAEIAQVTGAAFFGRMAVFE